MNVKDILVSIIIPVYNGSNFISTTLESVVNQEHKLIECIIIDDGSIDDTAKIVKEWIRNDTRFIYIYQVNMGLSSARNKGLQYCKGIFIQFLDADDVILPFKIEKQLLGLNKFFNKSELIVSYTDYSSGNSNDIYKSHEYYVSSAFWTSNYSEELIDRWESTLCIPPHCFLFSANLFIDHKIKFDTTLNNHEDFDCWLKIFHLEPKLKFVNEKLCIYRITDFSMSKQMRKMGEGFFQVLNNHIISGIYTKTEYKILIKKRRVVLESYRRFDLMNWQEKLHSLKAITQYYGKRILQKIGMEK
jgi:glycosyltransferase involved in cell wall biosynthesis